MYTCRHICTHTHKPLVASIEQMYALKTEDKLYADFIHLWSHGSSYYVVSLCKSKVRKTEKYIKKKDLTFY